MSEKDGMASAPIRLRRFVWTLVGCWTIAIGIVLTWELNDVKRQVVDLARSEASGAWDKDVAVRRWDAANGGVYVPVTKKTQPDPYLAHLPERDIATPSGRKLTLLGAAAIMRSIDELTNEEFGLRGHITSLRPIRPQNAPDPWEKKALEAFEAGQKQVSSVETIDGKSYLRLMRPLVMEQSCLKCHAEQGYKVGDIRGGVSVSVPMSSVWPSERAGGSRSHRGLRRHVGFRTVWHCPVVAPTPTPSRAPLPSGTQTPGGTRSSGGARGRADSGIDRGHPTTAKRGYRAEAGGTMAPGKRATIPRVFRAGVGRHGDLVAGRRVGRGERTPLQTARLFGGGTAPEVMD